MREQIGPSILRRGASIVVLCASLAAVSASAQAPSTTAEARRAAGEAFDRGTSSMLANDFRAAAHFFEQAYRLAPAAVALKQAIRAHDRSGNAFRAANLALRLRDQYPNDADGQALAQDIISRYGAQFVEVSASCEGCAILVNEALVSENVSGTVHFYIQPNATATVTASFSTGNVQSEATGEPGASVTIEPFVAPPPPPEPEPTATTAGQAGGAAAEAHHGLPRAVFFSAAAATVVAGGILAWSAADMYSGVNAYKANPTQSAYDAGHRTEIRTDALIGVTAGLGAFAVVSAILTDWHRGHEEAPASAHRVQGITASVSPTNRGAGVFLGGRF